MEILPEQETELEEIVVEDTIDKSLTPEISLHDLIGIATPSTMRVTRLVNGKRLHILIDSGSTYNFITPKCAKKLGCRNITAPTFHVQVANCAALSCNEIIHRVPMEIQGFQFNTHLFTLDLQCPDAVLGMLWLRSLRRILHDWKELTMEFTMTSRSYFILGKAQPQLCHRSVHSMQKLLTNGMESFLTQLIEVSSDKVVAPPTKNTTDLDQFLNQY